MSKTILVIGATGMLGAPVARQLLADGYHVRILARNPAKAAQHFSRSYEIVSGDVEQPDTLALALAGCDGVHINLAGGPTPERYEQVEAQGTANVARAAALQGVQQLTYLSASMNPQDTQFYHIRAKIRAEEALRASGVAYTIFRASWFMESLPLFIQGRRALLIGRQSVPLHWIAAQDYAQMVSRAYGTPAAQHKTFYVYGPERISMAEALATYCATVHPGMRITRLPIWLMALVSRITRDAKLRDTTQLLAYYDRFLEAGDPAEANAILGAPTTTLAAWCQQRLAALPGLSAPVLST